MPLDFVNVYGDPVSITPGGVSKPKPRREQPAEWHKGWSVEGYPPGAIEAGRVSTEREYAAWQALSGEEQAKRIRAGERPPKPYTLEGWLSKNKPKKVRARPFETPTGAKDMAALAAGSGWERVEVVELAKRKDAA